MSIEQACELVRQAERIVVLTGAGISAESGVPTFRGSTGLWKKFRPEELATPEAFARNPALVWEWYDWRRSLIAPVKPNEGHKALAELERRARGFTLVTQNVDGLHQDAGSRTVLELHGSIWTLRCTRCEKAWIDRRAPSALPHCECGAIARPGVVWFGENLPSAIWQRAQEETQRCDVFLMVGTSAVVYPAADLVQLARRSGARVIEVNLELTPISGTVDVALSGPAGEILPQILKW